MVIAIAIAGVFVALCVIGCSIYCCRLEKDWFLLFIVRFYQIWTLKLRYRKADFRKGQDDLAIGEAEAMQAAKQVRRFFY